MKKIFLLLVVLLCGVISFCQPVTQRSSASVTVQDARGMWQYNAFIPRYADTTAANVSKGIDSCGAIIYTYTGNTLWVRACSPKRWITASSGAGGISSFNFNSDSTVIICYSSGICDTISMTNNAFVTNTQLLNSPYFLYDSTCNCWVVDSSRVVTSTILSSIIGGGSNGGIVNGWKVTWSGFGLKFYISGGGGYINGRYITSGSDSVTLTNGDPSNPRFDLIYKDTTGVSNYITGVAQANPQIPTFDPTYQLGLTAVLVNAGDNVPADIADTLVYDENLQVAGGEWNTLATNVNVHPDQTPIASHLTHSTWFDDVGSLGVGYYIASPIPIASDAVLRFKILFSTFGDNSPVIGVGISKNTFNPPVSNYSTWVENGSNGFDSTNKTTWQEIAIPISQFKFNGYGIAPDSADFISISAISTGGSGTHGTWYIDEVNLQFGVGQTPPVSNGVQSFASGNLDPLFNTSVTNNAGAITQSYTQQNADDYTVFANDQNTSAAPHFTAVDLSTAMVTGLLPTNLIDPSGASDGYVLSIVSGIPTFTSATIGGDTTIVRNGITAYPGMDANTPDTLGWGGKVDAPAQLDYDTYFDLNGKYLGFQQDGNEFLVIDPNPSGKESILAAYDTVTVTKYASFDAHAVNTWADFTSGANYNSGEKVASVGGYADASLSKVDIIADTLRIYSTLGDASEGYVWTLKDVSTGSGYWAAGGGSFTLTDGNGTTADGTAVDWGGELTGDVVVGTVETETHDVSIYSSQFSVQAYDVMSLGSSSYINLITTGKVTLTGGGQLNLDSQFTPANSTDATWPAKTLTADDTYLWYRNSGGTWVKIAWTSF